ncbi:AIG2-like family protein [Lineolata rhizophorae]|uniref:gamma-glutamylcyclotransferase n=1 Tax=Lineolata rhizophorae TaxID=578093 RepID=A0A6A6NZ32_9PEZI|nr:AIG2-like family protein [Lineolata rhizophorae]
MANTREGLYFGYGSNMWKDQMKLRCPSSAYEGIARLQNYRWIINGRGYANIVESSTQNDLTDSDAVWGMTYSLTSEDERALDANECVPHAYTKETLTVEFWPTAGLATSATVVDSPPERVDMLVYIDRRRTEKAVPRKEYVHRMNKGIKDALAHGIPTGYVRDVLREFIPEDESEDGARKLAVRQATSFRDSDEGE